MLHHWGDKSLHFIGGGLLGIMLSWWFGVKRRWLGLVGILVAFLLGGAGELAQKLFTTRGSEWARLEIPYDWCGSCPDVIRVVDGMLSRNDSAAKTILAKK